METGRAFVRALQRCIDLGVHVVNYSFGEDVRLLNTGEMIDQLRRMTDRLALAHSSQLHTCVHRHGIVFVSSAGNSGPALSSTGSPGASCDCAYGIGAYLTSSMVTSMYSMRENIPDTLYPWSSRGPR
jgi:tripeptidyl-peptidase-2